MNRSDAINELVNALSVVQGKLQPAPMNATNPFLKNKYADLGSVIKASRELLAENGLAVSQLISSDEGNIEVETLLTHKSGQYISSRMSLPMGDAKGMSLAQSAGAVITYMRRYSLAAILGMYADEDTDGTDQKHETKHETTPPYSSNTPALKPAPGRPYSPEALRTALENSIKNYQDHPDLMANFKDTWCKTLVGTIEKELGDFEDKIGLRKDITQYLIGKTESADFTKEEVTALWKWLHVTQNADKVWVTDPMAVQEIDQMAVMP